MTALHLKGSSRATVFVATVSEERRTRLVKPSSQLRELGDEDTNVFLMGLIDRYAARPEGECFNSMTLAHFAVWYNDTAAPVGDDDHSRNRLPRYELQNDLGTITQRRHSACLRVPVMSPESHGDDYYYELLMLYLPWRNERVDLLGEYQTAREALLAKRDHLQFLNAEPSSFADEVQRTVQQLSTLQQNQFGDNLYAPVAPSTMQNRLENGGEGSGFDPLYDGDVNLDPSVNLHCNGGVDHHDPQEQNGFQASMFDDQDSNILSRRTMTDAEFEQKVSSLNDSQRGAFACVAEYTYARHRTTWARDLHHHLFACSLLVVLGQVKVMSSASFMSTLNARTRNLATHACWQHPLE